MDARHFGVRPKHWVLTRSSKAERVDFRRSTQGRVSAQRGEQRRLVGLLLGMGLVLVALPWMANPANWQWIERMSRSEQAPSGADTSLARAADELAAETILVTVEEEDTPVAAREKSGDWHALAPQAWSQVRDDVAFRSEELPLFWELMSRLRVTTPAELTREAEPVTFAQLFQLPGEYRGRAVQVRGRARRAVRVRAAANDAGVGSYYQVWLQPTDNPSSPVVIFSAELPAGFPEGMEIATEELTIPGVFFKRWPYNAQDGLRTAPALVAGGFEWTAPKEPGKSQPVQQAAGSWLWRSAAWGAVLAVLAVGYVWWRTRRGPDMRVPQRLPDDFDQRLREELP
jgi:hypothetical protein